jgi:hypothetical protein
MQSAKQLIEFGADFAAGSGPEKKREERSLRCLPDSPPASTNLRATRGRSPSLSSSPVTAASIISAKSRPPSLAGTSAGASWAAGAAKATATRAKRRHTRSTAIVLSCFFRVCALQASE